MDLQHARRTAFVYATQLLHAVTNVRRARPEWTCTTITLPPGQPIRLAEADPGRTKLHLSNKTAGAVMLSPVPPSTMSGQGACQLRPFGERILPTTAAVYGVSADGTVLDVLRT